MQRTLIGSNPKDSAHWFFQSPSHLFQPLKEEEIDFRDLDNSEDNLPRLLRRLMAIMFIFAVVFASTAWFISENLDEKERIRKESVYLYPVDGAQPEVRADVFIEGRELANL